MTAAGIRGLFRDAAEQLDAGDYAAARSTVRRFPLLSAYS